MKTQVIILIDAEKPMDMQTAQHESGKRLSFESHEDAERWCEKNAEPGHSYMHWDGCR